MAAIFQTGGALNKALAGLGENIGQGLAKRAERAEFNKILGIGQEGTKKTDLSEDEAFRQQFLDIVQSQEDLQGTPFTPQDLDTAWNQYLQQGIAGQDATQARTQSTATPQYSTAQLAAISQQNPELARLIQQQQIAAQKSDLAERKLQMQHEDKVDERTFKINQPLYEGISKARQSLPERRVALERIENAIQSGDLRQFTDWAAGELGLDPLKSTQAQILESAAKELFVGGLKGMPGTRLNQLIESTLYKALQSVGKSPEANQEITETFYAVDDMINERIRLFDELSETYEKAGRELPRTAEKMIDEKFNPYVKDKLSELSKVRKELSEGKIKSNSAMQMRAAQRSVRGEKPPAGTVWVLAPNGGGVKPIPLGQLNAALKDQGRLVKEE